MRGAKVKDGVVVGEREVVEFGESDQDGVVDVVRSLTPRTIKTPVVSNLVSWGIPPHHQHRSKRQRKGTINRLTRIPMWPPPRTANCD